MPKPANSFFRDSDILSMGTMFALGMLTGFAFTVTVWLLMHPR